HIEGKLLADVNVSRYQGVPALVSKFDLLYDFAETNDGWQLRLEYNNDIYHEQTIERWADHLEQLLAAVIRDAKTPIGLLDYITGREKEQLLTAFNDSFASFPRNRTIMDLWQQRVRAAAHDVALVYEGGEMTCEELNEKANKFGDYLRKNYRVGPDDLVGIKLERGEWLIIAMLGVLKSGAAYLPVDPDYPEDRIAYMIDESRCKVL